MSEGRIGIRELREDHLVSCQRVAGQLDSVVCYDRRLSAALRAARLRVEAPV